MKTNLNGQWNYLSIVIAAKNYLAKNWCLNLLFLMISMGAVSQGTGVIKITITDKKTKEPIPFVNAVVFQGARQVASGVADLEGVCFIKPIAVGKYKIKVIYIGYVSQQINNVSVNADKTTYLNIGLDNTGSGLDEVTVTEYKIPIIDPDTKSGGTVTRSEYSMMAVKVPSSVVVTSEGVYASDGGSEISVRGSRSSSSTVFIDGERVIGKTDLSKKKEEEPAPVVNAIKAGTLTAGEINDFKKWDLWKEMEKEGLGQYVKVWNIDPDERYSVFVMDESKKPIIDADVFLRSKSGKNIWAAKTDNSGRVELWANMFEKNDPSSYIEVQYREKKCRKENIKKFRDGINNIELPVTAKIPDVLDVLFVVDATGSMGDEINYLKEEMSNIISTASAQLPCLTVNLGSVFYRDWQEEYVTRSSPLSPDIKSTIDFIKEQSAYGGGDFPEAVNKALDVAINETNWSKNAVSRLLFLVLDAPPHDSELVKKQVQNQIMKAAEKGIHIIPLAASGINKSTEYLMRSMALATNGTYVFLTDHSGVGNPHIKPSTNEYDVELLNGLLLRLIKQYSKTATCDPEGSGANKPSDSIVAHEVLVKIKTEKQAAQAAGKDSLLSKDSSSAAKNRTVKEIKTEKSFKYYPNPTRGKINIEVDGDIKELYLSDGNGKLIERYDIKNEKNEIAIGAYPEGMYLLQYLDNGKWSTGKVVLIRN